MRRLVPWLLATSLLGACQRSSPPTATLECGRELGQDELWRERSEAELTQDIERAKACGKQRKTKVLLEFVAPWCADCREMTRIEQSEAPRRLMTERYERVRINVGHWDKHEAIRQKYGITAIAAFVVLDPETGEALARTTLEPVTGGRPVTPELWAAWLQSPK